VSSSIKALRLAIQTCEIPHPAYVEHLKPLRFRIDDALDGAASRIERVMGPSRVGKSMLINTLQRDFPETRSEGRRRVPVLVVRLETGVSPKLLPSSVLKALGLPVQGKLTSAAIYERMVSQLRLAGTRVLIFEEASHLVDHGSRVPPRAAADWFKSLAETLDLTLLMFGVPRLERLFACNEQLRLRASAPRHFLPYDSRLAGDMQAFHTCVATYAKMFREAGYPIDLPAAALTYQCYLLTGGLIGVLSRFMEELAAQMAHTVPRSLNFADCQAAARAVEAAGSRHFPAFARPDVIYNEVAPASLHQAFVQVMNDNEFAVPVIRDAEGALV
jgi:hypothetical protein